MGSLAFYITSKRHNIHTITYSWVEKGASYWLIQGNNMSASGGLTKALSTVKRPFATSFCLPLEFTFSSALKADMLLAATRTENLREEVDVSLV